MKQFFRLYVNLPINTFSLLFFLVKIPQEDCVDRDNECKTKASQGKCVHNFINMLRRCPAACRFCSPYRGIVLLVYCIWWWWCIPSESELGLIRVFLNKYMLCFPARWTNVSGSLQEEMSDLGSKQRLPSLQRVHEKQLQWKLPAVRTRLVFAVKV